METINFKKIKTTSNSIKVPGHGWVKMNVLTEDKAKELFDQGFTFLAITKKGALKYYGEAKPNELIKLINDSNSTESAKALASVNDDKKVKEALKRRLKSLK